MLPISLVVHTVPSATSTQVSAGTGFTTPAGAVHKTFPLAAFSAWTPTTLTPNSMPPLTEYGATLVSPC